MDLLNDEAVDELLVRAAAAEREPARGEPEPLMGHPSEQVGERLEQEMRRVAADAVRPRRVRLLWWWALAPATVVALAWVALMRPGATPIRPYALARIEGCAQAMRADPVATRAFLEKAELRLYLHPAPPPGELATHAGLYVERAGRDGIERQKVAAEVLELDGAFRITARAEDVFGGRVGPHTLWVGLANSERGIANRAPMGAPRATLTQWVAVDVRYLGPTED